MVLTILYIASLLDAISFAMIINIMTSYLLILGGTKLQMGALGSISAFISLISNPIIGSLSDSLGRKKVLLQCLFVCFLANFVNTLSATLYVFFFSRLLASCGTQIPTLIKSLIDDNVKSKEDKMNAINKVQAMSGVAFVLGSLISGQLSDRENGIQLIFYLISGMFVVNFGLVCLLKSPTVKKAAKPEIAKKINIFTEIKTAAKNLTNINWPKYWDLFSIKLVVDFVLNIFQFTWGIILTETYGLAPKHMSYIFATMMVLSIGVAVNMERIKKLIYKNDNNSGFSRLLHVIILFTISYIGFGLSTSLTPFVLFLIPLVLGRSLYESTITEMLLFRASPEEKGSVMGAFDNTMALGGLVAPITSGIISSVVGDSGTFISCTIPLVLGGIIVHRSSRRAIKSE